MNNANSLANMQKTALHGLDDTPPILTVGELVIYLPNYEATVQGRRVDLNPFTLRLLCFFAEHANETVSRQELIRFLWAGEQHVTHSRVSEAIRRLRRLIEVDPSAPTILIGSKAKPTGYRLEV